MDIRKAGLLVVRDGRMLLCRKQHGTQLLILPGGKFEPGESAHDCVHREIAEELGPVQVGPLEYVGTYRDRAAGEDDRMVEIELYTAGLDGDPVPQSEIAELVWFRPDDDADRLSPTIRNRILPDLAKRGVLGK